MRANKDGDDNDDDNNTAPNNDDDNDRTDAIFSGAYANTT